MSNKYHISPKTGRPNKCYAEKKPCPIGGSEEHYPTKEAAREAYEKQNKGSTLAPAVKKEPKLTNPNGTPIAPVATKRELDQELANLEREDLYGNSLRGMLEYRGVNLRTIEAAEAKGDYSIDFKVPSYYETACSTDLARRELGLPSRTPTDADRTPKRLLELEISSVEEELYGKVHSHEEAKELEGRLKALRHKRQLMRYSKDIEVAKSKVNLAPLKGRDYLVHLGTKDGMHNLGSIRRPMVAGEEFEALGTPKHNRTPWTRLPAQRHSLGKFATQEEALDTLILHNLRDLRNR